MGSGARRGLSTVVPWVAVAILAALVLALLGGRRPGPQEAATAPPGVSALPWTDEAGRAASDALDAALVDLEACREGRREAEAARDAARARAEASEAQRATARARSDALEEELAAAHGEAALLRERLETLGRELAEARSRPDAPDETDAWLRDAARPDPEPRARARRAFLGADPPPAERVLDAARQDPERLRGAAWLLGGLPPGEEADAHLLDLLDLLPGEAGDLAPALLDALGEAHLSRPALLERLLGRGSGPLAEELLGRMAGWDASWPDARRSDLLSRLLPLLQDEAAAAVASRAAGILRLEGAERHLAVLLEHTRADVRAAAAHALSRLASRTEVEPTLRDRLPDLLADEAVEVRTAAVLLVEALLGRAVDFDPRANEATRRAAVERIRSDLRR